jgi:hypothetical protein
MILSEIEMELLTAENTTPGRLAELLVLLSAKYAQCSNELETILLAKPSIWNEMRKDYKSDTATDRAFQATEMGLAELKWTMTEKKITKMMSAIRSMIQVRTNEANSVY